MDTAYISDPAHNSKMVLVQSKTGFLFINLRSVLQLWTKPAAQCGATKLFYFLGCEWVEIWCSFGNLVKISSWRGQEKVLSLCSGTKEAPYVGTYIPYPLTHVTSTFCLNLANCICVDSTRVPRKSLRLWPWLVTGTCSRHYLPMWLTGCFPGCEELL